MNSRSGTLLSCDTKHIMALLCLCLLLRITSRKTRAATACTLKIHFQVAAAFRTSHNSCGSVRSIRMNCCLPGNDTRIDPADAACRTRISLYDSLLPSAPAPGLPWVRTLTKKQTPPGNRLCPNVRFFRSMIPLPPASRRAYRPERFVQRVVPKETVRAGRPFGQGGRWRIGQAVVHDRRFSAMAWQEMRHVYK